jgi:hypothetical protein
MSKRAAFAVVFGGAFVGFAAIVGSGYYAQRLKGLWKF